MSGWENAHVIVAAPSWIVHEVVRVITTEARVTESVDQRVPSPLRLSLRLWLSCLPIADRTVLQRSWIRVYKHFLFTWLLFLCRNPKSTFNRLPAPNDSKSV